MTHKLQVLVLGATGGIGRAFVAQAVERGHHVTAVARRAEQLATMPGLSVVIGDPLRADMLAGVVPGHDAVVSALGSRRGDAKDVLSRGATALVLAMPRAGVSRLLIISAGMLFPGRLAWVLRRFVFRETAEDSARMEQIVRTSALDVTIVRPPRLTDAPGRGLYRAENGRLPPSGFAIPRADVARFLVDELERGEYRGAIVGVCS